MNFNLNEYVDVAERLRIFREKHPEGSLQSEVTLHTGRPDERGNTMTGVFCKAFAYRNPDDPRPGIGHSYLAIPGKTPYTKDSEVENAETSAWGRAIVAALAADTKKIASADEVRARQGGADGKEAVRPNIVTPSAIFSTPEFRFASGKHEGKTLAEVPRSYLEWYLGNGPRQDVKEAITVFIGLTEPLPPDVDDIPF